MLDPPSFINVWQVENEQQALVAQLQARLINLKKERSEQAPSAGKKGGAQSDSSVDEEVDNLQYSLRKLSDAWSLDKDRRSVYKYRARHPRQYA